MNATKLNALLSPYHTFEVSNSEQLRHWLAESRRARAARRIRLLAQPADAA